MRGKGLKACAARDFLSCTSLGMKRDSSSLRLPAAARLLGMTANGASGVESLLP
jgi:hypothetical protein